MTAVSSPGCVEAAAITGRPPMAALQRRQLGRVGRRRRHVELEIAGGDDVRRAELAEALGIGRRARQAEIEPPQQIANGRGR